ncbi:hypothetical protein [Pediococcus cellicola]|uniref:Uncharacterized protein n=1 Tax=Pediococcus cellicola TaxID=319652 RepID=A0A0R2IQR4_9LACO|nr:hypothetical protein [Pediococcus cellicola]KRN67387.1 hypothetical protein IV80_GL000927 [Pediococcus cellicola]GEL15939.1 hypothetical protein PCE01_17410 [Pediococcus cellicola]
MKKNDEDRIFLIHMWNKVGQLEKDAQLEAQVTKRRQLKWQRRLKVMLVLVMILTTLVLILLNAGLTATLLSQGILMVLCLIMDLNMESGGKINHDRNSGHQFK